MDNKALNDRQYFLPDTCRAKNVLYLTLIAQLLAVILALNTTFLMGDFWSALSLNSLFILWVAYTCAGIFCAFKQQINQWRPIKISLFIFFSINAVTVLITWLVTYLLPQLELFSLPTQGHINVYLKNIGISIIVSAVLLRFLYIQFEWEKQTRAEAEARLDALQARIRPHFLFNSLNTIASLTRINPPLAETLTEDLAELFRANMQTSKRLVPFKQELALIQQYLNIEKTRLAERLTIDLDLSDVPDDALIPPLSIQPLIENAVYHGIEASEPGGTLHISGRIEKDKITLLIKNPISDQLHVSARTGNNMAIENIRLRMQSCFPEQSSLLISASDNVFQAQLSFPYQTSQA